MSANSVNSPSEWGENYLFLYPFIIYSVSSLSMPVSSISCWYFVRKLLPSNLVLVHFTPYSVYSTTCSTFLSPNEEYGFAIQCFVDLNSSGIFIAPGMNKWRVAIRGQLVAMFCLRIFCSGCFQVGKALMYNIEFVLGNLVYKHLEKAFLFLIFSG